MDTEIIRLGPRDAKRLERVAEDVFDEAIDPARVAAYLAQPGHMLVVAVSGGERAAPFFGPDSIRSVWTADRSGWRAGAEVARWGIRGGVAALHTGRAI